MGNCYNSKGSSDVLCYYSTVTIYIQHDDLKSKFLAPDRVRFRLFSPIKQFSETFHLSTFHLKITSCVLQGQDPRGEIEKRCQDTTFVCPKPGHLLLGLCDGHGSKGEEVVRFVEKHMQRYFEEERFSDNSVHDLLADMYEDCDREIMSPASKVNTYGSGTTAITLVLGPYGIHAASVGDSRAVLATLPKEKPIAPKPLSPDPFHTPFTPLRILEPIQLTVDQKPNLESELERIIAAGGSVCKAKDNEGNPFGPYRVFQKGKEIPGLAMSRSIGDGAAKKVGVTAVPIIDYFPLASFKDQFIVMASDGVWDTMDNSEVVNFVETFRQKALKEPQNEDEEPVTQKNATVARLLAEEARFRWLGMCSREDVMIDDISVLVAEILMGELMESNESFDESQRTSKFTGSYLEFDTDGVSVKVASVRDTVTGSENSYFEDEGKEKTK
jgi:serine/threonine protein phosphatase PrpC